jgi:hypothetical protein
MTNHPIFVSLGDQQIPLSYSYQDFREAEKRTRLPLLLGSGPAVAQWSSFTPAEELEIVLFIGVCTKLPELKSEEVHAFIGMENLKELQAKTMEAFRRDCAPVIEPAVRAEEEDDENPTSAPI